MLSLLLYPSRFSLTFTTTGMQTGLTSCITWGNCSPLFCVHPAISGWKYPPSAVSVSLNAGLFHTGIGAAGWACQDPWLDWGRGTELSSVSDLRLKCRSCASFLKLLQGFSKGIPQQFVGAAVINAGKDLCRTRTGKVWLCLNSIAGFKSQNFFATLCCSSYFSLETFTISSEITPKHKEGCRMLTCTFY